jgi:3',5'-cyclic-AMP phosphodiesterase
MKDVHFVHLTDLHIVHSDSTDEHLFSDTATTLRSVKSAIAMLEPRPSFVVISGDLTNRGIKENFLELKRLLSDIELPVLLALGNHDTREGFYEFVLEDPSRTNEPYCYSKIIDGLHIIVLDSSTPNKVHGTIEPEQFEWLEQELMAEPELPKIVVVHHPTAPMHLPIFNSINFDPADALKLEKLLEGKNVIGVLSGHVHFDQVSIRGGVPYFISTGLHNQTDVLEPDGLRAVSGASWNLCYVRDNALNVVKVPLPSDQTELHRITQAWMDNYRSELEAKEKEAQAVIA